MTLPFFLAKYRGRIAEEIGKGLLQIGEDRVRFLIANDIPLWEEWPGKAEAVARLAPHAAIIAGIDLNDLASRLLKILAEINFSFIPQPWLVKSLEEARREILKPRQPVQVKKITKKC